MLAPDDRGESSATERGCVLYTYNVCGFYRLHKSGSTPGASTPEWILAAQQRFSVGEQLRRILRVRSAVSPQQMRNRIEFLANWR